MNRKLRQDYQFDIKIDLFVLSRPFIRFALVLPRRKSKILSPIPDENGIRIKATTPKIYS